jgi:hypothetical protein
MSDRALKPRPCGSCGAGVLRPTSLRGRLLEHKDDPAVRVRADLVVPVCDACGDMALNAAHTRALEAALEEAYVAKRTKMQRALINDLKRRGVTQQQIEQYASVSPGYVSKLRNGGKIASGNTFRLLYLLHEMPEEALRVVSRLDPRVAGPAKRGRRAARRRDG